MKTISGFDPSTATSGQIITNGVNPEEQLMLYNDSPYGLLLTFVDNSQDILPAFWNKDFIIKRPMMNVKWQIWYTLQNAAQYPISQLYGSLYEKYERVASVNASMNRGIVVTNQGGVPVSQSNTLINQGAPSGTVIEEISSSANAGDTFKRTNDGLVTMSVTVAGVLFQMLKTQTVDPYLLLGAINHLIEILGNLQVDGTSVLTGAVTANNAANSILASSIPLAGVGNGTLQAGITVPAANISGAVANATNATLATNANILNGGAGNTATGRFGVSADGDVIDANDPANLFIKCRNAGAIHFQVPNGTDLAVLNANGLSLSNGINYNVGRIKDFNTFGGTGSGTYNHGISGSPTNVFAIGNVSGGGSATFGASSFTATQVVMTVGASIHFLATAYR